MTQLPWDRFTPSQPETLAPPAPVPKPPAPVPVTRPIDTAALARQAIQQFIDTAAPHLCDHARQTLAAVAHGNQLIAPPPQERNIMEKLKSWAKAIAAGIGSLLMVLTFVSDNFGGFLPENISKPLIIIIGLLTTVVTWLVPNKKPEEAAPPAPA